MAEPILVLTNTPTREEALQIASAAVAKHLAAAVHILGPITSIYRWEGKIETTEEWYCLIKTRRELYGRVEQVIHEFHSYTLPAIVAWSVLTGSQNYMRWIEQETQSPLDGACG